MKFTAIASSMLFSGLAAAQDQQSKPFNLVISSSDSALNGQELVSCHSGAAIQSLCIYGAAGGSEFFFNTTEGAQSPLEGYEADGSLVWDLNIQPTPVSLPMSFFVNPSSNIALPLLRPSSEYQAVTFSKNGTLAIFGRSDDTQTPPADKVTALRNWFVCQTSFGGYNYQTLAWVLGKAGSVPQNPSCVGVDVIRKFV